VAKERDGITCTVWGQIPCLWGRGRVLGSANMKLLFGRLRTSMFFAFIEPVLGPQEDVQVLPGPKCLYYIIYIIYIYIHTNVYVCIYIFICMYIYIHVYIHTQFSEFLIFSLITLNHMYTCISHVSTCTCRKYVVFVFWAWEARVEIHGRRMLRTWSLLARTAEKGTGLCLQLFLCDANYT
jgi:hypothetical protein